MKIFIFTLSILVFKSVWSNDTNLASMVESDGGYIEVHSFYKLLEKFDIQVNDGIEVRHLNWEKNNHKMSIKSTGGLQLYAPHGGLKAVLGGQLYVEGVFSWQLSDGRTIEFNNLTIRPTKQGLQESDLTVLEIVNQKGQVVFQLNNIHAGFNQQDAVVFFENMDLRISPWLANHVNRPSLANHIAGLAHMYSNLVIPADYHAKPFALGACTPGDNWPEDNPDVDVALIQIQEAEYLGDVDADHVIFTPSATLENVGTADVAWWEKFSGTFDPYNNDQHPYLIWNMYREIDNRFEQIGVSGVKHAFFTVNTVCGCSGGQVLFPTCQDKYSVGNNDAPRHLGPRDNISAFSGLWKSTGSFFDQNGDGIQETNSTGLGENRMVVAKADFADDTLSYYISSWYIIRDDVNIFNNMGYKAYDVVADGNAWDLNALTNFSAGPASDQYVTPNSFDLAGGTASQRVLQADEGHLTVAVKVIDLGSGFFRYNYMVENHDYDPQVSTISIPLNDFAVLNSLIVVDADGDVSNDWTSNHTGSKLVLQAQPGNEIDWGTLHSFSFTTDMAPQAGDVELTGLENAGTQFDVPVITPFFIDLIFENGFEILN